MRNQFLIGMLAGWFVYTKEGRNAANNLTKKLINTAKESLNIKDEDVKAIKSTVSSFVNSITKDNTETKCSE